MITQDSDFKTEKNAAENKPIYLYTIEDYDGASNDLTFAEYDSDVTYDGITYYKFPIKHEPISENSEGQVDALRVSVANVNRAIQAYLEAYDLRGKKVTIRIVWANKLDDADAHVDFILYIDTYSATETVVEFTLTSKMDLMDVTLPFGKYNRNYCRWKFKGTECGYSGSEASCDKRKATCETLMDNIARFGAFPSVPTNRIFV